MPDKPSDTAVKPTNAEQKQQIEEQQEHREKDTKAPLTENEDVRRLELLTKDGLSHDEQVELDMLMGRRSDQPDEEALAANVERAPTDIEVARLATLLKTPTLSAFEQDEVRRIQRMTAHAARNERQKAHARR